MLAYSFLILIYTALTTSNPAQAPARFCVVTDQEYAKCEAIKKHFTDINLSPGLQCVRGLDIYDCMLKVERQSAELFSGWFMDIYIAGKYHNLIPILAEKYRTDSDWTESYRALAVIKKADDSIHSLEDLRGKKSCHSGFGSLGGWLVPSATLKRRGLLPNNSCINNVPNLADFFSESCAASANSEFVDPKGQYKNMCSLCSGNGDSFCTKKDPYAGYTGALKCLVDGHGDVAFVIDTIWEDLVRERPELAEKESDYELLCLNGSRGSLDKNATCNWGLIPPRGVMASPNLNEVQRKAIANMFLEAQKNNTSFSLFESASFGRSGLIFSDNAIGLVDPGQKNNYRDYVGDDFLNVLENQYPCSVPNARWCAVREAEYNKCLRMRDAFAGRVIKPDVECLRAQNKEECMELMGSCEVDLASLDSGDIYKGGKKYGLKPFMYEAQPSTFEEKDVLNYAIAVVKKNNTEINYKNLKNKKSCHPTIGNTAGWTIPIGFLMNSNEISRPQDCDFIKAGGEFFSASCAPQALEPKYNPHGTNPASLCELCIGNGTDKCTRSNREPYYGYTGAFRCLAEDAGDVAFVKDVIPILNTDRKNTDKWAKNLKQEDFELLCRDGSRRPIDEFENCNIAKMPASVVTTCPSHDSTTTDQYVFLLNVGQLFYGNSQSNSFRLFDSEVDARNLLFNDNTIQLREISGQKRDYRQYLGNLADVFDGLNTENCS